MNTNKIKNLFYHVGLLSQLPEDLRPPSPSENYSKSMNDNNTNNNKKNGWRILYTLSNSFSNSFDNKDDNELIHEDSISLSDDGTNNNDCDDTMYSDQSSVKSIIKKILSVKSLSLSYKGPFSNNDGNEESGYIHYDVFLGGSCGHTIWRRSLVIPYLIKRDISYYDPQRKFWTEAMIYEEAIAKENSSLFLYVLDPETINAVSFLEIAYFASRKTPKLVVVFLDKKEWKGKAHPLDLPDRQRTCDLIELILTRHNVPLLTSINEALDYVDDMIIGEKNWKIALKNKKQRMTFLKIQCQRMFINLKKKLTSYRILPKYYKKPYVKSSIDKYQSDDFNYCKNIFILISIEIIILIFLIFTFPTYLFLLLPPNIYNIFLFLVVILLFNISCLTGIPKIQRIIKKFHSNRYQISEKTLILPNPPIMRTKSFMLNENGERIMENGKLKSPTNLLSNDIMESLKDKNDEKNNNINKDIPSTKQNLPVNKYLYNTKNRGMSTNEMFPKITRQSASGSLLKPYPVGYDVFLSCSSSNELDWITQKAIPILEKFNLSHISSSNCVKEMKIPLLHTSSHILYYIPSYKTFLSGMIEVAYYIGQSDLQVTVCVPSEAECLLLNYNNNSVLDPQTVAAVEKRNECYKMAFTYLKDMANRSQVRVYTNVEDAIKHIVMKEKRKLKFRKSHNFGVSNIEKNLELPSTDCIFNFDKTSNCSIITASQSEDQLSYCSGTIVN